MKSAEERAEEVCTRLNLPKRGIAFVIIQRAILEQDTITRHACAEAVVKCDGDYEDDIKLICAGDAYEACMNVKAV